MAAVFISVVQMSNIAPTVFPQHVQGTVTEKAAEFGALHNRMAGKVLADFV